MAKIIKAQIVDKIYEKISDSNLDKQSIQCVMDTFFDEIKEELKQGNTIELRGFGIFENKFRKEKIVRSPKTGEKFVFPAHYVANFKAGKELKQALMDFKIEK